MSIASRLLGWLPRRKRHTSDEDSYPERREFVYLDEVSVLSISGIADGEVLPPNLQRDKPPL